MNEFLPLDQIHSDEKDTSASDTTAAQSDEPKTKQRHRDDPDNEMPTSNH
jgi:hypothetical protein